MRNYFTLLLLLLLFSNASNAQAEAPGWKYKNGIRGQKIRWADEQTGLLCAIGGCAYFTTDGGANWDCVTTSSGITGNTTIAGAAMLSANHMVVLTQTKVFVTFTGPTNFTSTLTSGNYFKDVSFVDDLKGWVVSESGSIYKTTNGGATWTQLNYVGSTNYDLTAVAFASPTIGCTGNNNGKMYYTTNGTTFTQATLPGSITADLTFTAIRYSNTNEVIACASSPTNFNAVIIRSVDGGQTWATVHSDIAETLYDMDFRNADTVFAVGFLHSPRNTNGSSLIYQSVNGGQSWTQLSFNSFAACNFYGIDFANPTFGWIAGWDCMYKYDAEQPTGFSEMPLQGKQVSIYPNPTADVLHININDTFNGNIQYEVVNATGQLVESGGTLTGTFDVNTSGFAAGLYLLRIKSNDYYSVKTFEKK